MNTKCKLLSASILIISLFQLYFQYSSMMTPRDKKFHEKDSRNNVINIIIFTIPALNPWKKNIYKNIM